MSRVGKLPVEIKDGVNVAVAGQKLDISGKKGKLSFQVPDEVHVKVDGKKVLFTPVGESKRARAMWGMTRNIVKNMVQGVAEGYHIKLEIEGVGFRAAAQGKVLKLNLGFSHDVNFPVPEGIEIKTPKPTEIDITGVDKQLVGQVAANIRLMKKPEPYKGKGIRYAGERIRRKEGKKK
jgi:large subunit ribosomal protein L6